MRLPLEGIKVIEIAEYVAGPTAARVMADWGADVIKIEHPERGDRVRGTMRTGVVAVTDVNYVFGMGSCGKRSLALDITTQHGKEIVYKLVENSDLFVTNMRRSARKRHKIDYKDLSKLNPRLVYVEISGYGEKGPERDRPGYDYSAYWARGAIAASLGEPGTPPPHMVPSFGDLTTGMVAAGSAMTQLYLREKTGKGGLVSLSLLATGMWMNAMAILAGICSGTGWQRFSRKKPGNPLWNMYQTKDNKWLHLTMLETDLYWDGFCKVIGDNLRDNPDFSDHVARCNNSAALVEILDEVFPTRDLDEWGKRLDANGCIWGRVQEVLDLLTDPQVLANKYLQDVPHPVAGSTKVVSNPAHFSRQPLNIRSWAPELGQHTEEVLLEIGLGWDEISALKNEGVII